MIKIWTANMMIFFGARLDGVDEGPTDGWTDGPNTFNIAWFPALGLGYLCAKFGEDW